MKIKLFKCFFHPVAIVNKGFTNILPILVHIVKQNDADHAKLVFDLLEIMHFLFLPPKVILSIAASLGPRNNFIWIYFKQTVNFAPGGVVAFDLFAFCKNTLND